MTYKPGLHILAEFTAIHTDLLENSLHFREFLDLKISAYGLHKVGETWYDFEGAGFTAVVCLTESHISIHTWPEYGLATFDIFLSNYEQVNDGQAQGLYHDVLGFYQATVVQEREIKR